GLVPSRCPSSPYAIAIIIHRKAARAALRYATAIVLNLATSALKGTDAFGPGSNRIEQLVCRLDREKGKPRYRLHPTLDFCYGNRNMLAGTFGGRSMIKITLLAARLAPRLGDFFYT